MSNYIYTNDGLINADELAHYGVPGMRWGHKKARYVTGYQAQKKATKAANEARKKSIAESRTSGDKGIGSFQRANRKALNAKRKAYGESIKADYEHNNQLRADKNAAKQLYKKIKQNSGRDKYYTDLTKPIQDDVKNHAAFKQYKKTAKDTWRKYLDESDRMDNDYEATLRKIHKDPNFKEQLADVEKHILLDYEKGSRGYEKSMEYAIDSIENDHPLLKQHRERMTQHEKTRDEAYDSAKAVADEILGKYRNRPAKNMNMHDAKARDIVESVISDEMMYDHYNEKYKKQR